MEMTDKEILDRVLVKMGEQCFISFFDDKTFNTYGNNLRMDLVRGYLFDHIFAKAFWGGEIYDYHEGSPTGEDFWMYKPSWQYHLQQMVLEENPIRYLEQFLDK
jgi:hypothetical protein